MKIDRLKPRDMQDRHSLEESPPTRAPRVSIVIPMHNEEGAVAELVARIAATMRTVATFEIVAVDDGSTDGTLGRLRAACETVPQLRVLHHPSPGGQSAAIHSGVLAAQATVCCTLDGDGQNPPENLPRLLDPLINRTSPTVGLVAGQRVGRQDTFAKKAASRLANALRDRVLKDGVRDTGCGLKAFDRDAFLELPYFDHMHRYLPALFAAHRQPIVLVEVTHEPRTTGQSKYTNIGRAAAGVWDLLGVLWLKKRAKKVEAEEVGRND